MSLSGNWVRQKQREKGQNDFKKPWKSCFSMAFMGQENGSQICAQQAEPVIESCQMSKIC